MRTFSRLSVIALGVVVLSATVYPSVAQIGGDPIYVVGQIPDFSVSHGLQLRFQVSAGDPASGVDYLGAIGKVEGRIGWESDTRTLEYEPAEADRLPFRLWFRVPGGAEQTIAVTPEPLLPADSVTLSVPGGRRPEPDDAAYQIVTIVANPGRSLHNGQERVTDSVTIAGSTVRIAPDTDLWEKFHYQADPDPTFPPTLNQVTVSEFTIHADRVVIGGPLRLPGANVSIYARQLEFEDSQLFPVPASIDTTPLDVKKDGSPCPNSGCRSGKTTDGGDDGVDGQSGGRISLWLGMPIDAVDATPRLISNGGRGQPGKDGPPAKPGRPTDLKTRDFARYSKQCGDQATECEKYALKYCCNRAQSGQTSAPYNENLLYYKCTGDCDSDLPGDQPPNSRCLEPPYDRVNIECGRDVDLCSSGNKAEDAKPGSRPGNGGPGGSVESNHPLSGSVSILVAGGEPGVRAPDNPGGKAVTTVSAERRTVELGDGDRDHRDLRTRRYPCSPKDGKSAVAPSGKIGPSGTVLLAGDQFSWVSPYGLRMHVAYARDLYIEGFIDSAFSTLREYQDVIDAYQDHPGWEELPTEVQSDLQNIESEIGTMLVRIEAGLDFFGNPAGWAPRLSFEVLQDAFQREVVRAGNILYLADLLERKASSEQEREQQVRMARDEISARIDDLFVAQEKTLADMTRLGPKIDTLKIRIELLDGDLKRKEKELQERARDNVEDRHKEASWKKNLRVIAKIAKFIPVPEVQVGAVIVEGLLNVPPNANFEDLVDFASTIDLNTGPYEANAKDWSTAAKQIEDSLSDPQAALENVCQGGPKAGTPCDSKADCQVGDKKFKCEAKYKIGLAGISTIESKFKDFKNDLRSALGDTRVPESEVERELQKLKARDREYQGLVDLLADILAKRKALTDELVAAQLALSTVVDEISTSYLTEATLAEAVLDLVDFTSARATTHVRDMKLRALNRLQRYIYLAAASYEYRFVRDYRQSLTLQGVVDELIDDVKKAVAGSGGLITVENYKTAMAPYLEAIDSNLEDILENIEELPRNSVRTGTVTLTDAELVDLNAGIGVPIELGVRRIFAASDEDIRLLKVRVLAMDVEADAGKVDFNLAVTHDGEGKIERDGKAFRFQVGNSPRLDDAAAKGCSGTATDFRWNTQYNSDGFSNPRCLGKKYCADAEDTSDASILSVFLENISSEATLLFSAPPGLADVCVQMSDTRGNPRISYLVLEVEYRRRERSGDLRQLNIVTEPAGIEPYFMVSIAGDSGETFDGRGSFRRYVAPGAEIHVEIAPEFEAYEFQEFAVEGLTPTGSSSDADNVLRARVGSNATLIARFAPGEDLLEPSTPTPTPTTRTPIGPTPPTPTNTSGATTPGSGVTVTPTPVGEFARLTIAGGSCSPGSSVGVSLTADLPDDVAALVQAEIDIHFDPEILGLGMDGIVCNPDSVFSDPICVQPSAGRIRIIVGSNVGIRGSGLRIADFEFDCIGEEGDLSHLELDADEFVDATESPIPVRLQNGQVEITSDLLGDVSCNGSLSGFDGRLIFQQRALLRVCTDECPVDTAISMNCSRCDVTLDGECTSSDGRWLLQYAANLSNPFCPDGTGLPEQPSRIAVAVPLPRRSGDELESATVRITADTVASGECGFATVSLDVPEALPALVQAELDLTFDPAAVSIDSTGIACNPDGVFEDPYCVLLPDRVRFVAGSNQGLRGESLILARVEVCDRTGMGTISDLDISVDEFVDASESDIPVQVESAVFAAYTPTPSPPAPPTLTPTATDTPTRTPVATATASPTDTPKPASCIGDCDGSGDVTVDEIVTMVNLGLTGGVERCAAGDANSDDAITVDEVVAAIANATSGCAR